MTHQTRFIAILSKQAQYFARMLCEMCQSLLNRCGDVTYFFPLMRQVEQRLGYKPRFGTFDAAFDAWYVYAYFYDENDPQRSFAVVPFSEKGGYKANAGAV